MERAAELAKERGAKRASCCRSARPSIVALMQPAQERLAVDLEELTFNHPRVRW